MSCLGRPVWYLSKLDVFRVDSLLQIPCFSIFEWPRELGAPLSAMRGQEVLAESSS